MLQSVPAAGFRPVSYSYAYPLPVDFKLPTATPVILEVIPRKQIRVDARPIEMFYYGSPTFSWFSDSQRFYYQETERGHKSIRLLEVDANTGSTRPLVEERADTMVNSTIFWMRFLNQESEIIWTSERDGWNHFYLYDAKRGQLKNQITKGAWVVRGIEHIDEKARQLYFTAGGHESDRDPYLRHLYRINLDGTGLILLTPENADHSISFSPDGQYFVDAYSRVDLPTVSVLRRAQDGSVAQELEKANIQDLLATGWKFPEPFKGKGRDGRTEIYGLIWRPTNFNAAKKYPIVENIYTGPHSAFVPKTFGAYRHPAQVIAELGFISVFIDGMGTALRSKAFHDVSYKNLGDGGLPDHIAVLQQMAARYPYMDISRVGIWGHSAGGYDSTHAILTHPEFYKVAVSSSGNHDHRMDKAWWNESWMSWPVEKHYIEQSNMTLAGHLKGKLLLAHGDLDENVPVAATIKLVDALIKANKDFDLILMPNRNHSIGNDSYFVRRRWDFFVRHLLGVLPPADYQIREESVQRVQPSS
jgi:dipeptidyl aminopeptidase/acylaminoacyl peptidase